MKVPLVDLRASYLPIKEPLFRELEAILDGMALFLGPNVQAFEEEFAAFCESPHGVAVSNGTDAILAALEALGIGRGDEVIVPSLTFFATVEAVAHAGATPVFADVAPDTLTLDPDAVRAALSPATRAILPVHLCGHPADMDAINAIARARGLRVVEDAAQAHGARDRGRRCGSLGDAAAFSFYFTKNLGAFGEAGFVTAADAGVAERVRLYRHHGHTSKFEHALIGRNLRMDEIQAAVLRLKLPRLEAGNARRRAIAARYDAAFAGTDLRLLRPRSDAEPVYHLYPLRHERRDALREHLERREIGTGIHYKIPGHLQPAMQGTPHRRGELKVTEEACRTLLSIPMFPELTDAQIDHVIGAVREFLGG
jgi:dTDP-4-amino-4,6-dideoxygalactose transaminase